MDRLAAFISPGRSLEHASARATAAEVLGYDLVLTNHIANRDGLLTLAAYGATTSRVRLGTGVYPALLQTPLSLGHQAATLDEVIGGRLVLGLGTSHRPVIEGWHGLEFPGQPVEVMREITTVLRAMFRDGGVDFDGDHVRAAFRFRGFTPRPDLEIHLAALSPAMLRLAGEVADGVMLWLCNPDYIASTVVPEIAAGAERAGRDPAKIEIIPAITCAVANDPEPALAKFRRFLVTYLSLPFYRRMLENSGFGDDLARFDEGMADGDVDRASASISREMIDSVAGIGSADDVRRKIAEYRDAGGSLPGIGPLTADGTTSFEETLAVAIGKERKVAATEGP
jgi:alkanesulfonate monooxygenase SsuD/methylene tetrahydromethanopterin reductase-like flavin-dependent oxidoreductase (luciferase family)